MTLLYNNQVIGTQEPQTRFDKFFNRLYKFKFLIPIFPKWSEAWDKYWYQESLIGVMSFSIFFYLMGLFFIYLGIADRGHLLDYFLVTFGWFVVGLVIPSGGYRSTIYLLKRQKIIE